MKLRHRIRVKHVAMRNLCYPSGRCRLLPHLCPGRQPAIPISQTSSLHYEPITPREQP